MQPTTLFVTLVRDSWVAALWDPSLELRLATMLINAFVVLTPSELESHGWISVVQPALDARMLTRLNNHTMALLIPALPEYELAGQAETVRVYMSPELVTSDQSILVEPALEIIGSESVPLRVSLLKDSWQRNVGLDDVSSAALLAGLRARTSTQAHGWNGTPWPQSP